MKRGIGTVEFVIIFLVLALIILSLYSVFGGKIFGAANSQVSSVLPSKLQEQSVACKLRTASYKDTDKDGDADFCDICQGGNDYAVTSPSLVPDDCLRDPKATDPAKACCGKGQTSCEGILLSTTPYFQCKSMKTG
jgi:hypothetical protein